MQKFFFRPITRRLTVACAQLCHKDSAASVGTEVVATQPRCLFISPSAAAKKICEQNVGQSSSIFNHTIKDREWSEDVRSWLRIIASQRSI